jgi:hypothetical protein
MRGLALSIGIAALSFGAAAQSGVDPFHPIRWQTYRSGTQSRIGSQSTFVIRSSGAWQNYWAQSTGGSAASAPRDVEFNKEFLVAIHLGTRPTAGYSVVVDSVKRSRPAEVLVRYAELTPDPKRMQAQVLTSPFTIIRVENTSGALAFEKTKRVDRRDPDVIILQLCCCGCWDCNPTLPGLAPVTPVVIPTIDSLVLGDPQRELAWRAFQSGEHSRIVTFGTFLIRNEQEWRSYWTQHTGEPARLAPREFDWTRESVAAIHLGTMSLPGYRISVEKVERVLASDAELSYVVVGPRPVLGSVAGPSSPFALVRLPRLSGSLHFRRRDAPATFAAFSTCPCRCFACSCGKG